MTEEVAINGEECAIEIVASCVSLAKGTGLIYVEDSTHVVQLAAFMTGEHELTQLMDWANMYVQICISGLWLLEQEPKLKTIRWPEQPLDDAAQQAWYEALYETCGRTIMALPIPDGASLSAEALEYVEETARK